MESNRQRSFLQVVDADKLSSFTPHVLNSKQDNAENIVIFLVKFYVERRATLQTDRDDWQYFLDTY